MDLLGTDTALTIAGGQAVMGGRMFSKGESLPSVRSVNPLGKKSALENL